MGEPKTPLYVVWLCADANGVHHGCMVLNEVAPIQSFADIRMVTEYVAKEKGYDPDKVVIVNFRRMETA